MLYETEKLEFKQIVKDDIYKTVIAFANTDGGTLYIGITNDGEVMPLADVDQAYTTITNGIRDAIEPDVTIFVKYTLENAETIRIEIAEGSYKPYYLKSKGLKPSGVYVRQGASTVPTSPEQIRQMIKNTDGDVYENLRSMEQELTFSDCADVFAKHKIEFNDEKYNVLGIRSHTQQLYTNLALLLSDQCAHSVKVAVFADAENTVFRDRKEFTGSVLGHLEETYDYLQLCNKNRSVIDGLTRADYWDYPKDAIREALLNAIVHRDYGYSGDIIINVNDTCMEFVSIGGLLPGISTEDIRNGISQLRNKKLAEVFHRLNFIEAYGTGIRRIFALYRDCPVPPTIDATPNSFKITLPNMNAVTEMNRSVNTNHAATSQEQIVLDFLNKYGEMSFTQFQELLGVKKARGYELVKQMADTSLIQVTGRGESKKITR